MGKFKTFLWVAFGLVMLFLASYIFVSFKGGDVEGYIKFITYPLIGMSIIFVALITIYYFRNIKERRQASKEFKEVVDVTRALERWKEGLVRDNGIPYREKYNGEGIYYDPNSINVTKVITFSDPSKETSDRFCRFEVLIREGDLTGWYTFTIRLDRGEEWIRNNWNMHFKPKSFDLAKLEPKRFPLTSSKSEQDRLQSKKIDLMGKGYDEDIISQFEGYNPEDEEDNDEGEIDGEKIAEKINKESGI